MFVTRDELVRYIRDHSTTIPGELNTNIFITGASFHGENLSNMQLRRSILAGCIFYGCNFDKAMLQEVSLQHCQFDNCTFAGADAGAGIHVVGATFNNVNFEGLHGDWRFTDCGFFKTDFKSVSRASIIFDDETKLTACDVSQVAPSDRHDALIRDQVGDPYVSCTWSRPDDDKYYSRTRD